MTQIFSSVLILITVGLNTIAQILLKLGANRTLLNSYFLGGIAAYGLSTLLYIMVLSKLNLSIAYPVVIGLTVVAATMTGAAFLHERISVSHWLGIGLMLSGISAIALSQTT